MNRSPHRRVADVVCFIKFKHVKKSNYVSCSRYDKQMCTPYDTALGRLQISVMAGESQCNLSIYKRRRGNA